jgi:hypothetical protein
MTTDGSCAHHADFSVVAGGPLYRLLVRFKLVKPPLGLLHRRVLVCLVLTWLPLAVLTALSGNLVGEGSSFLSDVDAQMKLAFALPLLIAAEPIVHRGMGEAAEEFLRRGLVAPEDESRFEAVVALTTRLRNSTVVEIALLLVAAVGGHMLWRSHLTLPVATWYAGPEKGGIGLTRAGYWYAFASLPIARFILLRWCYRLFIWYVFFWKVSRLALRLDALHPDRAGGLAFLEHPVIAYVPVLMGQSAFLVGAIGDRVLMAGARLPEFKYEILGFIIFLVTTAIVPLLFFCVQLAKARVAGAYEFGRLATRYVGEFEQKWLGGRPPEEGLLGTADLQSLADLANSYQTVRSMRAVPFEPRVIVWLTALTCLPVIPVALTMIPIKELAKRVVTLFL